MPVPEKLPDTRSFEIDATVNVPAVRVQANWNCRLLVLDWPRMIATAAQLLLQFAVMVELPVVVRGIVIVNRSCALVFGTTVAMSMLVFPVLRAPAAHALVKSAVVVEVSAPDALNEPEVPPEKVKLREPEAPTAGPVLLSLLHATNARHASTRSLRWFTVHLVRDE